MKTLVKGKLRWRKEPDCFPLYMVYVQAFERRDKWSFLFLFIQEAIVRSSGPAKQAVCNVRSVAVRGDAILQVPRGGYRA